MPLALTACGIPGDNGAAMDIWGLFWIFLILASLQPVIRQRMLEASRSRLMVRLEKQRGSRVICLVHRQETMSILGFPLVRYIDINDSEEVIRAIELTDDHTPIDIILHTPGGLVLASLQIARAMARHKAPVTVFVPHYAMSGGTLIAMSAQQIVMAEHAVLGPMDPQVGRFPAASVLRAVADKPLARLDDETLILADQARMAIAQVRRAVRDLLQLRYPEDQAERIAGLLCEGHFTHDYPISAGEARALGLAVSTEMPELIFQLMSLYPQPVHRQASVEYLPGRRDVRSRHVR